MTLLGRVRKVGDAGPARRCGVWVRIAALLVVFIAYALRAGTLTLQSMWIDEVWAMVFTQGAFTETIHRIVQPSENGPLFYLLLFGWRRLVGDSDLAVRFLSTFFSVLTIPLLFRWVRQLLTDRAAVLSIWLLAFSPFTLWYAQETKMYALHMMVAVASSLALLEAFRRGGWWRWAVYALLVSAVLYSHFFGAFLVASQAAMALLLGWRRWKRLAAYGTAMLLLVLAHLPLARVALPAVQHYRPQDIWRGFVPLGDIVRDLVGYYFYRVPVLHVSWLALLLPPGLVLAGFLLLFCLRRREVGVIPLQAFAPLLLFYAVSFKVSVYDAKYVSAILPALFVLVAWGEEALARLWRPLGVIVAVLGVLMLNTVVRDLADPLFQRGDWRYVADYVEAHEGENDLVVISAYYTSYAFERYYRGVSDILGFGDDPYDPGPFYQRKAKSYDHMWLVLHHDDAMAPGNALRATADVLFPATTGQFPNGGKIALFGYQMRFAHPALPEEARPLDVCFQNGVCLVGYSIDATSLAATERLSHPPSNWIHVVLYWRRESQVDDTGFRPLLRLVDGSLNVWGGNMDRRPDLFDRYPPAEWPLDEVVEAHVDMNLNPATPPGVYRLEVSLAIEGDENRRAAIVGPCPEMPADRFLFEQILVQSEEG